MISSLTTIATAVQAMDRGEPRSAELVESCLRQIERLDGQLEAWVFLDAESARREAQISDERVTAGERRGPLHGIPIGIKDIIDVAGMPTRAGSTLTSPRSVKDDATLVRRLRAAGAIILGKTVTTEFACFHPAKTRNPWDLNHTPGGSSSGSAVAVATGMCMAAVGSQTGGSILRPAAYCGVAGFKPTFQSIPLDGVVPVSGHLDHAGPLTRSAGDLARLHAALVGLERESRPPESAIEQRRFRRAEEFFRDHSSPETWQVVQDAIHRVLGETPPLLRLPNSFQTAHAMHRRIMVVDAAEYHRDSYERHRAEYSDEMSAMLDEGLRISAVDYATALRHQTAFRDELDALLKSDPGLVLVVPTTPATAPNSLTTTGDPAFNSPWTYAGLPTVTVPCGLDDTGMPVGVQLIGCAGSDVELLDTAAWWERKLAFNVQPQVLN